MADFKIIKLKRKSINEDGLKGYRIYSDYENFIQIQANTAAEAVILSKIDTPHKIESLATIKQDIIAETDLTITEPNTPQKPHQQSDVLSKDNIDISV